MTGVNASSMRPVATSEPVAMTAAVRAEKGLTSRSFSPAAAASAAASTSSRTTSGITRVPARASPSRTAKPPLRVATMTSSVALTARRRSELTSSTPSQAALMPILPSEGSPAATQPGPRQSSARRCAASFSCTMPGSISHT